MINWKLLLGSPLAAPWERSTITSRTSLGIPQFRYVIIYQRALIWMLKQNWLDYLLIRGLAFQSTEVNTLTLVCLRKTNSVTQKKTGAFGFCKRNVDTSKKGNVSRRRTYTHATRWLWWKRILGALEKKNFGKCTPNANPLNGEPPFGGSDVVRVITSQRIISHKK